MLVTATLAFMVIISADSNIDHTDETNDTLSPISVNILTWEDSYPYVVKKQNESNSSRNNESQKSIHGKYDGILIQVLYSLRDTDDCKLDIENVNICFTKYKTFYNVLQNISLLYTLDECDFEYNDNTVTVLAPTSRAPSNKNIDTVQFSWACKAGVIVRSDDVSLLTKAFKGIQDSTPLIYLSVVFAVIVGALIWLLEHRRNKIFHSNYSQGLWSGFWFSFVTMTTVGYGDKIPKHFLSRVITLAWTYTGILLTAGITAIVLNAITSNLDLTGKRVSVLKIHVEEPLVRSQLRGRIIPYYNYHDVLEAVINKHVDAAVIEGNVLSNVMKKKRNNDLLVEREVGLAGVVIYLAVIKSTSSKHRALYECLRHFDDIITLDLYNKFVETYETKYFLVRPLTSVFSSRRNHDNILVYTTCIAIALVGLAVTMPVLGFVKRILLYSTGKRRQK